MTTYESNVKTISSTEEVVFNILGDIKNLEKVRSFAENSGKVKDLQLDTDSCSFTVEPVGKVGFSIAERIPFQTIRLVTDQSPFAVELRFSLNRINDAETGMKLTLNADIPMMIKMMVDKKLKEGIEQIAEMLAMAMNNNIL